MTSSPGPRPLLALALLAQAAALLGLAPRGASAQSAGLGVAATFPCNADAGQFFDTALLECAACDRAAGYFPAPDGLGCVLCDGATGNDTAFGNGFSMASSWAPAALPAAAAGACACAAPAPNASVLADVHEGGRALRRCVACPAGSGADAAAGVCVPPSGRPRTPAGDLEYVLAALNAKGAGIATSTATQAVIQAVREPGGGSRAYTVPQSLPLASWLGPSARDCMDAGSRAACNALANLCALQMYSPDAAACQVYDQLVAAAAAGGAGARRAAAAAAGSAGAAASPRPETGPLPWLYYAAGSSYLAARDVDVSVSMGASAPPLRFVLSSYDLNGTWLGLHNWTLQLQACGAHVAEAAQWTRFGVDYSSSCLLDASSLLAQLDFTSQGPKFYDPYLQQDSGLLYPLPIRLLNRPDPAGAGGGGQAGHVRRFFFVDTMLSTPALSPSAAAPSWPPGPGLGGAQAVSFPSRLSLLVQIRPEERGRILPPLMTLEYSSLRAAAPAAGAAAPLAPASFSATYTNPPELSGAFWYAWRTMLAVLLALVGGPAWAWRVLRYVRSKDAGAPVDLELLLFAALAAADVLSLTLGLVLFLVSFYWLVVIKLQEGVLLLMPPDADLHNFWVTAVLALVGQSLGLAKMLYDQISVDIFFVDWERPRRVLAKGGGREEPGPVSAWRGLMVANEWSELQAARVTWPGLTLVLMVFILDGCRMASAAYIRPGGQDYSPSANVQQSMLLRFGIAAVWLLVVGVAQVLWRVLAVHRFSGNPLHGFVDLLFLANVSAVILEERHSGYYLHGRNQMRHSDTSLEELNGSLLREEEGLVSGRGLVTGYAGGGGGGGGRAAGGGGLLGPGPGAAALNDNQTFLLFVSPELRRRYEGTLLAQVEQAAQEQRANKGALTAAVRGPARPRASTLGAAFRDAIDEAERNHSTQVTVPTYWQRVLCLPPPPGSQGAARLQHDFHDSFSSVLFYGQELRLFAYEALLFSTVFMSSGSAAAAAFVTWAVEAAVRVVRQRWGENNLSRKTLVDRHFLI